MAGIPIRLDEARKTPAQVAQREATYRAAAVLRAAGFDVEVYECFTGDAKKANAAIMALNLDKFDVAD